MRNKKQNPKNSGTGEFAGKKEIKLIEDPRFSKIHTDPRFQKVPRKADKVTIDSRFKEILTDKRFASSSAKVDKRGKPRKQWENPLLGHYHLEEDEEDDQTKKKKSVKKVEEEESEGESSESSIESSESDSESDDSSSTSESDVDVSEDDDNDESVEVENVPVIDKETHRLAVVNMDWNQVKAVDIFMMLRSFLPKEGQIKSVTVYPSEFGLKRLEEEAVRGPVALFGDEKKKDDEGVDDEDDDDDEIDTEKLRAYEKSRLRYYYAVVECDSIATADYLYKSCDGVEFERSSNVLDLRFIPNSMEFPLPPRDIAKEAPVDYEGLDFQTRALQQSNVTLSWDDDEPHRVKTLRRNFNENQLAELELKEFLASDESGSDEDEDKSEDDYIDSSDKGNEKAEKTNIKARMAKKDMYRALVQSGDGSEEEEDEDEGQDMEVTFNTGLEDISKKILEKKDKGSESVWEAYLRKKREKKKARKYKSKNSSDDESDESAQEPLEQPDDFFKEDPSAVRSRMITHVKKKREEKRPLEDETTASTAELELLLADEKGDDTKLKGYKIKQKKGKGKKGREAPEEDTLPTVDYNDPRFSAVFSNPAFALDPTDPQFKRSATYFRQLAQSQQNYREDNAAIEPVDQIIPTSNGSSRKEDENSVRTSLKEKFEISSLVKSVKMRSQQLPKPSSAKISKNMMEHGSSLKEKKHKLDGLDSKLKKKTRV